MPSTNTERKDSPWKGGGLSPKTLALKVWQGVSDDNVLGRSGQLAYFFFFAIFPLGIFITAVFGLFAGPGSPAAQTVAEYITRGMPGAAADLVNKTLHTDLQASGGGKLTFGILLALFSASSGTAALMDTLNVVFGVKEGRSALKQRAQALAITIALGILMCIAMFIVIAGDHFAKMIGSETLKWLWHIGQFLIVIPFLLLSYSIVYYYAPNVEHPKWHWVTPGAAVGVALWIIVSFGLQIYLHFFDTYSVTYGALGAVMILMLWFYVTGFALLIGGEINAIIERAGTGKIKQQEPREDRSESKIEHEKESRQAQKKVNPDRVA